MLWSQALDPESVEPGLEPAHRDLRACIAQEGLSRAVGGPEDLAVPIHQLETVFTVDRVIGQAQGGGDAAGLGRDSYRIDRPLAAEEAAAWWRNALMALLAAIRKSQCSQRASPRKAPMPL